MADGRTAGAVAPNPEYRGTIVRAFEASSFLVENGIRFVARATVTLSVLPLERARSLPTSPETT